MATRLDQSFRARARRVNLRANYTTGQGKPRLKAPWVLWEQISDIVERAISQLNEVNDSSFEPTGGLARLVEYASTISGYSTDILYRRLFEVRSGRQRQFSLDYADPILLAAGSSLTEADPMVFPPTMPPALEMIDAWEMFHGKLPKSEREEVAYELMEAGYAIGHHNGRKVVVTEQTREIIGGRSDGCLTTSRSVPTLSGGGTSPTCPRTVPRPDAKCGIETRTSSAGRSITTTS